MASRRSTPRPKRFDGADESVLRHIQSLPAEPNGCILWIAGAATNNGYGRFNRKRPDGGFVGVLAHRFAWEQANGTAVPPGLEVLHSCDTPRCVNPAHLSVGTHKENMEQMARRGRVGLPFSRNPGLDV